MREERVQGRGNLHSLCPLGLICSHCYFLRKVKNGDSNLRKRVPAGAPDRGGSDPAASVPLGGGSIPQPT